MEIEIRKTNDTNSIIWSDAFNIRNNVFIKEQLIDPDIELDSTENEAYHYVAYYKGIGVGTARWRRTNEGIKLERFAVLKQYRCMSIASLLLNNIIKDIGKEKMPIYLHAQESAVSFYNKRGFAISGNAFYEANITHYKMIYSPTLDSFVDNI